MRGPQRSVVVIVSALVVVSVAACGGGGGGDRITADDLNPPPSRLRATSTTAPTTAPPTTAASSGWRKSRVDPSLPRQDIDVNVIYPATFTKDQAAVVRAWANFQHAFFVSTDPPNPESDALARFLTPNGLNTMRAQVSEMKAKHVVARIPPKSDWRELAVSVNTVGTTSTLRICVVDTSVQSSADDGSPVNDIVITKGLRASLVKGANGWKVDAGGSEIVRFADKEVAKCIEALAS